MQHRNPEYTGKSGIIEGVNAEHLYVTRMGHPAGAPDEVLLFEKGTANVAEDDVSREDVDISILLIFHPINNESNV